MISYPESNSRFWFGTVSELSVYPAFNLSRNTSSITAKFWLIPPAWSAVTTDPAAGVVTETVAFVLSPPCFVGMFCTPSEMLVSRRTRSVLIFSDAVMLDNA